MVALSDSEILLASFIPVRTCMAFNRSILFIYFLIQSLLESGKLPGGGIFDELEGQSSHEKEL